MTLSKVISSAIEQGRLVIKTLGFGKDDIQTIINTQPFGIDSRVPKNYRAIYTDTDNKSEKFIVGYIHEKAITNEGETRLFSVNSSNSVVFAIYLKADGTCELGGNTDNLAKFSVLKSEFDELNYKFNDLVIAFNQHMHATAAVGSPSPPTPIPDIIPALSSTADITTAKIDNLKV